MRRKDVKYTLAKRSSKQRKPKEVTAYRLVSPRHARHPLSGEGARRCGGRWNSIGQQVVYLASSRALAALELLVHLTTNEARLVERILFEVMIPGELIGGHLWPCEDWDARPATKASTDQGDDWLKSNSSLCVTAPSIIVPEEDNLLLNPRHPKFSRVEVRHERTFRFDPRLV